MEGGWSQGAEGSGTAWEGVGDKGGPVSGKEWEGEREKHSSHGISLCPWSPSTFQSTES